MGPDLLYGRSKRMKNSGPLANDADVPATLLLEERSAMALNAVAGLADPTSDRPFFTADLACRPAWLRHGDWDYGSSHGRLVDACVLGRRMSGCSEYLEAEKGYKEGLLRWFGEDGLSYRRAEARGHWEPNANLIDQRSVLLALTTWFLDEGDPWVRQRADALVAALRRIAIKERDVWYYPASEYTKAGWPSANAVDLRLAPDPAAFSGRLIMPLVRYYEAVGNEEALELALWFRRLIVERSGVFNEDGSFNAALAFRSGHFHTRLGTLEGLARLALSTGDHALSGFVRRSYDWARSVGTAFGWTPGDLVGQRFEHETCSLVDMIGTGVALATAGFSEYWQVVERYLRNHLAACQLLDMDWVEERDDHDADEEGWSTCYQVGRRLRGAFAGYCAPNDYVADFPLGRGHTADVQGCCVGSGVRGLFVGWSNVLTGDERLATVNLLLSRGGPLADVSSHLPFEGRVDMVARRHLRELRVRIPSWAGYASVCVQRRPSSGSGEGVPLRPDWAPDGTVSVRDLDEGEVMTVTFPLAEDETVEEAAGKRYVTTWRGDDVVAISPPGRYRPLYAGPPPAGPAPLRRWSYWNPGVQWTW